MKKIMKMFLAFSLAFGLISLPNLEVKASEDAILESFTIHNFVNEISTEDSFEVSYELNQEVNLDNLWIHLHFLSDKNTLESIYVADTFTVPEEFKKYSENYKFLYLTLDVADENITQYYSKYNTEELETLANLNIENIYPFDTDYSFVLTDADVDNVGPTIQNINIEQYYDLVTITFESPDEEFDITGVEYTFKRYADSYEYTYSVYDYMLTNDNGMVTSSFSMYDEFYNQNVYGELKLVSVEVRDSYMNSSIYDVAGFTVYSNIEDNIYESYTDEDLVVTTNYPDNKLHFRADGDTVYGNADFDVSAYDKRGNLRLLGEGSVDVEDVDFTQYTTQEVLGLITKDYNGEDIGTGKTVSVDVVVYEEAIGKVVPSVISDPIQHEYSGSYQDFENVDFNRVVVPVTFELNDGTLVQEDTVFVMNDSGYDEDSLYMMYSAYYHPKYEYLEGQVEDGSRLYRVDFYLLNDRGHVVDFGEFPIVYKDDREECFVESNDSSVQLKYLKGAMPSYTIFETEITSAYEQLFDEASFGYDMSLNADYRSVQPVDDVEITVPLPEEYKGQYFDVYRIDKQMRTYKLESTCSEESVTFITDEVSAFAIVKGIPKYTVTFVLDEEETTVEVQAGEIVEAPTLTKEGYYLAGWKNDDWELVDLTKPITENLVLYPFWCRDTDILKSFNIEDFTSAITNGDEFNVSYELKQETDWLDIALIYRIGNNVHSYGVDVDSHIVSFNEYDYIQSTNAEFLAIQVGYNSEDGYVEAFYSKYNRAIVDEYISTNDMGVYYMDMDYSFTYRDVFVDNQAPSVEDVEFVQNRDKVAISFTTDEDLSGLDYVEFGLVTLDEYELFISSSDFSVEGNQYTVEYDLYPWYANCAYGTYDEPKFVVYDEAMNKTEVILSFALELKEEDNRVLTLTADDLIVETNYVDDKIHLLREDGQYYGSTEITVSFIGYCGDKILEERRYEDLETILDSGNTFTFDVKMYADSDPERRFPCSVDIVVDTERLGSVYEFNEGYVLPYTESAVLDSYRLGNFVEPVKVKLYNGDIIDVETKVNYLFVNDDDGYYGFNKQFYLDPRYEVGYFGSEEENFESLLINYTFIDEHKNVTDRDGNIVVKYEDLELDYILYDNDIFAKARRYLVEPLFGYLTFEDVSNEITGIEGFYKAYDFAYVSDGKFEPKEVVDPIYISFTNEKLVNKAVNIYTVSNDGTKTLVDTVVLTEDYAYEYTEPVRLLLEEYELKPTSITLNHEQLVLEMNTSGQLIATVEPFGAEQAVTWSSSNKNIASVDKYGKVTAKAPGTVTITAKTVNGLTATCEVTVNMKDITTKVTRASSTSLKVSWNKVSGATGYEVYRSTTLDGTYKKVKTITKGTTLSWTNTKLTNGTTYFYKVRAYKTVSNKKYYGEYSEVVGYAALSAPSVTAKRESYNAIKLTWKAINKANAYEIYRSTSKTGAYELIDTIVDTSYVDTNLLTAKTYYYKVKAIKNCETQIAYSSFSTYKYAKTTLSTPKVTITNPDYQTINLSWNAIDGVDTYEVRRATKKDGIYTVVGETSDLTFNDTNVTLGKTYYYKVRGYHNNVDGSKGYSSYSTIVSKKVIVATPKVTITNPSYDKNVLDWQDIPLIKEYQVYRSTSKTGTYTKIATLLDSYYEDTTVVVGKTYYYKVRAVVDVNETNKYSSYSTIVSKKVVIATPKVTITNASYDKNILDWQDVALIKEYQVYRSTSKTGTYTKIATLLDSYYEDTTVVVGKTYYYKVRAVVDVNGTNKYSSYSTIVSKKVVLPKPANLVCTSINEGISITFDGVFGADGYEIYRATSSTGTYSKVVSMITNEFVDTKPSVGKTYYYKVRAYRLVNNKKVYSSYTSVVKCKR